MRYWQPAIMAALIVGLIVSMTTAMIWLIGHADQPLTPTPAATVTRTVVVTPQYLQPLIDNDGGEKVLLTRPHDTPHRCTFDHWAWNDTYDYAGIKCRGLNDGHLIVVKTEFLTPLGLETEP